MTRACPLWKKAAYRVFCAHSGPGFFWFRIFWRFGIAGKRIREGKKPYLPLMFSERYGHTTHIVVGGWSFAAVPNFYRTEEAMNIFALVARVFFRDLTIAINGIDSPPKK